MKTVYEEWVQENVTPKTALGRCAEWTEKMVKVFPELKRVRGTVLLLTGLERHHWWLTDEAGTIVDPTLSQFTDPDGIYAAPVVHYEVWDESQPEPTGKCPNCGDYCYNGSYCCSKACELAYVAYCNSP